MAVISTVAAASRQQQSTQQVIRHGNGCGRVQVQTYADSNIVRRPGQGPLKGEWTSLRPSRRTTDFKDPSFRPPHAVDTPTRQRDRTQVRKHAHYMARQEKCRDHPTVTDLGSCHPRLAKREEVARRVCCRRLGTEGDPLEQNNPQRATTFRGATFFSATARHPAPFTWRCREGRPAFADGEKKKRKKEWKVRAKFFCVLWREGLVVGSEGVETGVGCLIGWESFGLALYVLRTPVPA